jgi:transposase InsO family protein
VRKLVKAHGLRARGKRKFKATTNSSHGLPVSPNLLERRFAVEAPNRVWAGDITRPPPIAPGRRLNNPNCYSSGATGTSLT